MSSQLFQEVDWNLTMNERFENFMGPFIPVEPTFNEKPSRQYNNTTPQKGAPMLKK